MMYEMHVSLRRTLSDRPTDGSVGIRRHALTDNPWQLIKVLPPKHGGISGQRNDQPTVLGSLCWRLRMEVPWHDLTEGYEPWQTIYD